MANATAITVRDLAANSQIQQPAADVLDTGTAAVTLDADLKGQTDLVVLEVKNTATANLAVDVLAGDHPPAFRAGLGNLTKTGITQNQVWLFGPFEAARFNQDNGKLSVKFTPASGTIGAEIRCYRLPRKV
jgi:hypothetical protein